MSVFSAYARGTVMHRRTATTGVEVRRAPIRRHDTHFNPFAVLRVASRAPRASREPAGSPIAPQQPPAPPFGRSPRRSRGHAKNSKTMSGVPTCSRVVWCFPWITPHRRIRQCVRTSEHAVKTHICIAKQGLQLDRHGLYEMLQILSVALFAQVPLHQLLTPPPRYSDADVEPIALVLLCKTLGRFWRELRPRDPRPAHLLRDCCLEGGDASIEMTDVTGV